MAVTVACSAQVSDGFFGAVRVRITPDGLFSLMKPAVGKYNDRCMRYCLFFGNLDYGRYPGGG